jgi:hypothetical protein
MAPRFGAQEQVRAIGHPGNRLQQPEHGLGRQHTPPSGLHDIERKHNALEIDM